MSTPNVTRRRMIPPTLAAPPRTPVEVAQAHLRAETEFVAMRLRGAAHVLGFWLSPAAAEDRGGPTVEDEVSLFVSGALEGLAGALDAAREAVWEAEHPGVAHPDAVARAGA